MKKILVIEDESAISDTIHYALTTDGFEVKCVSTGRAGIEEFVRGDYALVILDVGLPDKNGFEVCKSLRQTSSVPVIFLTARGGEVDRVVGLEIGADDYVVKPFSPRELCARVKNILRRASGGVPANESKESSEKQKKLPFVVDAERHSITYFKKPLELSRYEFLILQVLVSRPGWVFSREKLMNLLWESPEMSMERTIDTHVKTLRAKLREINSNEEAIITHRGVGYALKEDW